MNLKLVLKVLGRILQIEAVAMVPSLLVAIHYHESVQPFLLSIGLVLALGTLLGGRRIIDTVCREMTHLPPREGFGADLGAGLTLACATLLGLPVSTTHAKTAAVLGAGMAAGLDTHKKTAGKISLVWLATFPACFGIGFCLAKAVLS